MSPILAPLLFSFQLATQNQEVRKKLNDALSSTVQRARTVRTRRRVFQEMRTRVGGSGPFLSSGNESSGYQSGQQSVSICIPSTVSETRGDDSYLASGTMNLSTEKNTVIL